MRWLRGVVYRLGFRPRPGSVFYSPSLAWSIAMSGLVDAMLEALVPAVERVSAVIREMTPSGDQLERMAPAAPELGDVRDALKS